VYQHLNNQGRAIFLLEDKGIASFGCAVYQKDAEFVDQIYDAFLAVVCNVMRELWGSRWAPEEVQFSRANPADVGAYRRFFRAPCRFRSGTDGDIFSDYFAQQADAGSQSQAAQKTGTAGSDNRQR